MSGVEVERKWLVETAAPEALDAPAERIDQGYLTIGDAGAETRVRRKGDRFWITVKSGSGLARNETEVELTAGQFEALWPATEGARVEKVRHSMPTGDGHLIELDVYSGVLDGLIVVEVEFDDPWGAESFVVPFWFGREITADAAYKNQRLAVNGLPAPN
jgi:adenylate cyclase